MTWSEDTVHVYSSTKRENINSLYWRQSPSCYNIFRPACIGDSSHPVGVTGPFIFPSSEEPYLLWPTSVRNAVVELPSHHSYRNTHTHTVNTHTCQHTTFPWGHQNLHVPAITNADNCSRFCSICIPVPQRAWPLSISVTTPPLCLVVADTPSSTRL